VGPDVSYSTVYVNIYRNIFHTTCATFKQMYSRPPWVTNPFFTSFLLLNEVQAHNLDSTLRRVETKFFCVSIFVKMRKSCKNGLIFAKFHEMSFRENLTKISRKQNISRKRKVSWNFTVIPHAWCVVSLFYITPHFGRIKRTQV
jgi:ribosomal protein S21